MSVTSTLYDQDQASLINKLVGMIERQQSEIEALKAGLEQVKRMQSRLLCNNRL